MSTGVRLTSGSRAAAGFTLTELIISVSVMAILLALAVPSFRDAGLSSELRASANSLIASTNLARSEAIKRNAVTTLCVSSDGSTCTAGSWEAGWILASGGTVILHQAAAAGGYQIVEASGIRTLSFQPTGVGATAATFTVCRATPTAGTQERVVTVNALGRASVQTVSATTSCP
jgi:type IV fimbrial biogenesis protein FimT